MFYWWAENIIMHGAHTQVVIKIDMPYMLIICWESDPLGERKVIIRIFYKYFVDNTKWCLQIVLLHSPTTAGLAATEC